MDKNIMYHSFKLTLDTTEADKDWEKYRKQLQKIINGNPAMVKVLIDKASVDSAMSQLQKVLDLEKKVSQPLAINIKAQGAANAAKIKAEGAAEAARIKAESAALTNKIKAESAANSTNALTIAKINRLKEQQAILNERLRRTTPAIITTETNKQAISEERLRQAKLRTAAAQDRFNQSLSQGNKHLMGMRGLMNGIPQLLTSYVSILGGMRFVQNIKDVTGEFELQRVALAAIIQDKAKANSLFAQIVDLGLQSPFQIKELLTYTKQLAAFRVENDKLFGTMSNLADISAGLGVDMSRLILAYGQVKAASVLRGQELRQFTEAGIPLVDLLAKEFTKLNGVMTTTGDVFELISKRQVPFSMIEKLFKQMTSEGGTFYNMQLIQAQTLKGVWSNLVDAYDKMFMEMGNANMGLLKAIPTGLKGLADNWESILSTISQAVIAYGAFKVAVIASNAVIGKENALFLQNALSAKAKRAEMLRQSAIYRKLNGEEAAAIWTGTRLTASNLKLAISSGKLTQDMALRLIATRKLNAAQAQTLINEKFLTQAQVTMAMGANRWKLAYLGMTASLRGFLVTLKATSIALLSNPLTWFAALAYGIGSIVGKMRNNSKALNDSIGKMSVGMQEYVIELKDSYKEINETVSRGLIAGADDNTIKQASTSLRAIIDKNESLRGLVEERLKGLKTELDRLKELKKIYGEVVDAASGKGAIDLSLLPSAAANTGSWTPWNDDVIKNADDFKKAIVDVNYQFQKLRVKDPGIKELQVQFSDLIKQFNEGRIPIDTLISKMASLTNVVETGATNGNEGWRKMFKTLRSATSDTQTLKNDFDRFAKTIKANITEINGQKIDFGNKDKWGLTQANYNTLRTGLETVKEMWFRTADDIQKGVVDVLWSQTFMIPKPSGAGNKGLSDFAKTYNEYLDKQKFTLVPKIEVSDEETTEDKYLEGVLELLNKKEERQADILKQRKEGNKFNESELKTLNEEIPQYQKIAKFWGLKSKATTKEEKQKPAAIDNLEKEVTLIKEAYDKYQEYQKLVGSEKARKKIEEGYKGKFESLSLAFNDKDMQEQLTNALELFKNYGKQAAEEYFKTWNTQSDIEFKGISENMQKELEKVSEKISQTEKSNKFFEEMFGLTGDEKLSKELALKFTGFKTGDVAKELEKQLISLSKELIGVEIPLVAGRIDVSSFRDVLNSIDEKTVGLDRLKIIKELFQKFVDAEAESVKDLLSGLDKYQTYEDRKAAIISKGEKKVAEAKVKSRSDLIPAINKETQAMLAELDYENFRTSGMYSAMFENLDKISTASLKRIREKVISLSTSIGKDLSPTNLKELISQIEELDAKIAERDPFSEWKNSLDKINQTMGMIAAMQQMIAAGQAAGFSGSQLQPYIFALEILYERLFKLRANSKQTFNTMLTDINNVNSAAVSVSQGVREVFEEFGIGEETIAYKSLEMLETISDGVSQAIQATAKTAEGALSAVDKASIILLIISTVVKVALKIYQMFSAETALTNKIAKLTKQVEYLKAMYDKLSTDTIFDPNKLKSLEQELELRKEMLAITMQQFKADTPAQETEMIDNVMRALGVKLTPGKNKFDWGAAWLTGGFNYWMRALINYGKLKKYKEYIEEANSRLEYQANLYNILNSSVNNIAKTAQARVENLKEQNRLLKEQLATEIARGRKMDVDKVLELQEKIAENEANIASAYVDTLYEAVGNVFTNLADGISNALTSAFENGTDALDEFGASVDKVMRNVVIDLWKANVLTKLLQPVMSSIYRSMGLDSNGEVTSGSVPDYYIDPKEAKDIAKNVTDAKGKVLESWGSIEDVLKMFSSDLDSQNLTGISKAIGSMSEESALTISSYANSLLYYAVAQNAIEARILEIMETGDGGAFNTIPQLIAIQNEALNELKAISANTKRSANASERIADSIDKLSISGGKSINVNITR